SRVDETTGPFMDTAAVLKNVDLVVAADMSIAHLAGALGVPVWVALPANPDFRWMLDRDDSPWYPTMRLFRQSRPGDWPSVFERIAQALGERRPQPPGASPRSFAFPTNAHPKTPPAPLHHPPGASPRSVAQPPPAATPVSSPPPLGYRTLDDAM